MDAPAHTATRPLEGRTVVVTRPRAANDELTRLLEERGATVILCPTIEVVEPDSWDALDAAIAGIADYHWIVFTSANGVRFFFRRFAKLCGEKSSLPDSLTVGAIGAATAKALEDAGARADVIARDSKAEGMLETIIERAGGREKLRGMRFLIPRARVAREVLPVELGRLGARVDAVEAYQTIKPQTDVESLLRLFQDGKVDVITFTSSSTVSNFAALIGRKDLSELMKNTLVACIGPVTAATAFEYGLTNIAQPEVYTAAALVETIVRHQTTSS
ncbi:MAG TPA: uroporphyrinogen-III synthase [Blastocatellia bacterium]|nr:uroporphyrinogen-III synthase [Blastocatellia bacterium]